MNGDLEQRFGRYNAWRARVAVQVEAYRHWLDVNEVADAATTARIDHLAQRLAEDKLVIAFVAEFSRGKSELINSLFFADYGRRLLPSSAGRTTMCPTEIGWDPAHPPGIRLLPIETRADDTDRDLHARDGWQAIPLDLSDTDAMAAAFERVRDTRRVPMETARRYGLYADEQHAHADDDGLVEVPCWRYAIINFPHPLLQQGVVILDTPGLNAIGTEPELTINLLPNAHAVVFVLACDTGVTQTDADVWHRHIAVAPGRDAGRMVVLNKIDTLWDGLRAPAEIDAEIDKQVRYAADVLGLPREQIFAASAQKGLLAKITHNDTLLQRSRIVRMEQRLAEDLVARKRQLVRDVMHGEAAALLAGTTAQIETRLAGVRAQLDDLRDLRGRKIGVVDEMQGKLRQDRAVFEQVLRRFNALRGIQAQQTSALFTALRTDRLNASTAQTLEALRDKRSKGSFNSAAQAYFDSVRESLALAERTINDIARMMEAMYRQFSEELDLHLGAPVPFSAYRYQKECDRLEAHFHAEFGNRLTRLLHDQATLAEKFFQTIGRQMQRMYEIANRDIDAWLRALLSPLEKQLREHQAILRRRAESARRIINAGDELEERIAELAQQEQHLLRQLDELYTLDAAITRAFELEDSVRAAA